ncbi:MAG TPA: hypothetical protein VN693_00325 [Rhodanobacteraceae bacterium]|nr:hypothetical protein [Rhodanobacteraceae bacterium]
MKKYALVAALLLVASFAAHADQAASTTARTTPTGAARSTDVCTLLPVAQAAQLSGQPYTTAAPTGSAEGWTSGCAYNNDDATAQGVNVNIDTSDRVANTWNLVHTGNISEISGVGDKAFWDKDNTLYAMSGKALIQVNGLESQGRSEALAKAIIHALH